MNINMHLVLKTLLFTLENGKNLSSGLELLSRTSKTKKERKIYANIYKELKDGSTFSKALIKYKLGSSDISQFIALAEESRDFKKSLKKIIQYLEVKDEFERESNDKITLPFIYFSFAAMIVIGVTFFGVPYQMQRAKEYSPEIIAMIKEHLNMAQFMTDLLFFSLTFVAGYFIVLMIALFSNSNTSQMLAKEIGLKLPFISKIIKRFEKFMLFSMLGEMLKSGISYQKAILSAIDTTTISSYKKAFKNSLDSIKNSGKFIFHKSLYDETEQELMLGVGSSSQIGSVMLEISNRARTDALKLSTAFFRMITILSILLMAFAVFIEFFTIVLTQMIIQKGLIDLSKGLN